MINKISFVTSTFNHVTELQENLRPEDHQEVIRFGFDPDKALYYSVKHALIHRTGLIDNKVAAMWGVVGTPLGLVGQLYLLTSPEVLKISPLKFARIYIHELSGMKQIFPILENYVDSEYKSACRMLELSGFKKVETFKTKTNHLFNKYRLND